MNCSTSAERPDSGMRSREGYQQNSRRVNPEPQKVSKMAMDPNECSNRQPVVQRNDVRRRQMDAAMRCRTAQGCFVPDAVDVNIAPEAVDVAAAIKLWLQAFKPENPVRDRRLRHSAPRQSDRFASAKYCALWESRAHFLRDAMQPERCLV